MNLVRVHHRGTSTSKRPTQHPNVQHNIQTSNTTSKQGQSPLHTTRHSYTVLSKPSLYVLSLKQFCFFCMFPLDEASFVCVSEIQQKLIGHIHTGVDTHARILETD